MVHAIAPKPGESVCDPACGTGGFLFTAHNHITQHYPNLTHDEKRHLKEGAFRGWELVQGTARACAMNLLLHGIGSETNVPIRVADTLTADPGERFDVVLANPSFGKKSSTMIEGADGKRSTEKDIVEWRYNLSKSSFSIVLMRFTRVTVDPQRMGGVPCIRGLRIPVATVVGMFADRMSESEILEAYPDLTPADLQEALRYATEAVREREWPLTAM